MWACNGTEVEPVAQTVLHLYHIISLSTHLVTCVGNLLLSTPLLVAISRAPSLLTKPRFLFLFNLLCCDNLLLLVLLAQSAFLTNWSAMPVVHCVAFMGISQFLMLVSVMLRAALSVDRCLAIKLPLRHETLLRPSRQRMAVAFIWATSLLLNAVAQCMALRRVRVNASLPFCDPHRVALCLLEFEALKVFCLVVSALVLPFCFITVLACLALLCWETQGRVCSQRRAGVTLAMQAAQMAVFSVCLVVNSLVPVSLHSDELDLAVNSLYALSIPVISLVYGYRSRELQNRLLKRPVNSQASSSQ